MYNFLFRNAHPISVLPKIGSIAFINTNQHTANLLIGIKSRLAIRLSSFIIRTIVSFPSSKMVRTSTLCQQSEDFMSYISSWCFCTWKTFFNSLGIASIWVDSMLWKFFKWSHKKKSYFLQLYFGLNVPNLLLCFEPKKSNYSFNSIRVPPSSSDGNLFHNLYPNLSRVWSALSQYWQYILISTLLLVFLHDFLEPVVDIHEASLLWLCTP